MASRTRSNPFSRSRGMGDEAHESLLTSLGAQPLALTRILSWTYAREGFCVGTPTHLNVGDTSGWLHVGWHEIERGDWNAETQALRWAQYGGRRGTAHHDPPARMPELLRERIAASIVLEKFVPVRGDKGVIISARRSLSSPDAQVLWHRSISPGLRWDDRGVEELAEATIADLRSEYEIV